MPQITKAMKGRRSANLLLAHIAAVIELDMGDRAWDSPQPHIREWLRLLAAEGYTLSEIEAEITGPLTPETATDQPTPDNGDGTETHDAEDAEASAVAA
ncbi:hypothetical protein ACFQZC_38655 [Streptacidiphilus monticola]